MSLENTASEAEEDDTFVDELKPGTELMHGQYTIESFLAAGGFGITYLARDSLNRRVVIKECFPGNFCRRQNVSVMPRSRAHQSELSSIVRLFAQEAMSLAKASHPNIVGVHQVFEENNTSYMALDFVQGRDLLEILKEDPESLTPDQVSGYLEKVLGAVQHIHDLGMLHRDISPDNVIISEANEPILIDFGAAREDSTSDQNVTRMLSALRVVKDGYSPQEFYISGSTQGPSCDLYSLAASFYHVITQEMPPDSQARLHARAANEDDPYVSLGDKVEGYSRNFVTALDKAMGILPNERMQSANDWLAHMMNEEVKETETPVALAAMNQQKQFPMTPVLLGSTAAIAVVAGAFLFLGGSDPAAENASEDVAAVTEPDAAVETPSVVAPAPSTETSSATESAAQSTEEQAVVASTEPETPTTANVSGVDFFVNMNTSQPDLIAAPRTNVTSQSGTESRAQNAVTERADTSALTTSVVAADPFVLSTNRVIQSTSFDDLPVGAQIVSVNGETVETNAQVIEQLNSLATANVSGGTFEVTFGLSTDGTLSEQTITAQKERQTVLPGGLTFAVRNNGDAWTTEVVRAPAGSSLQNGDQLVSYLATSEEINGWQSLQDILETGAQNGTTRFSFAIRRDGIIWVEAFDLSS